MKKFLISSIILLSFLMIQNQNVTAQSIKQVQDVKAEVYTASNGHARFLLRNYSNEYTYKVMLRIIYQKDGKARYESKTYYYTLVPRQNIDNEGYLGENIRDLKINNMKITDKTKTN